MREVIKTVRFTCDGGYYVTQTHVEKPKVLFHDGHTLGGGVVEKQEWHYCRDREDTPNDASITITGTKQEIENLLYQSGWRIDYVGKDVLHFCPRVHAV